MVYACTQKPTKCKVARILTYLIHSRTRVRSEVVGVHLKFLDLGLEKKRGYCLGTKDLVERECPIFVL